MCYTRSKIYNHTYFFLMRYFLWKVFEEVGFDIKDRAFEDQYLERELNGQIVRLYIIENVPIKTKFAAKTKNEIKVWKK